ncbi:hypothetical protein MMC18_009575 [Xylographa bjoerkii]|nr:hypothetical protein [Xylographa bjoerkii]
MDVIHEDIGLIQRMKGRHAEKAKWTGVELDDVEEDPHIFQLSRGPTDDDHPYAPTTSECYYIKMHGDEWFNLFGDQKWYNLPEKDPKKLVRGGFFPGTSLFFYVSLRFLIDLAKNVVAWDDLETGDPFTRQTVPGLDTFDYLACAKEPSTIPVKEGSLWIPARTHDGLLVWGCRWNTSSTIIKDQFYQIWMNMIKPPPGSDRGWRCRWENIELSRNLLFRIAPNAGQRLRERDPDQVTKIFQSLIEEVNHS